MSSSIAPMRQPARLSVIARQAGQLAAVWAVLVLVPAAVAFRTGEHRVGVLLTGTALVAGIAGVVLSRLRPPQRIHRNEAMIIASSLFVLSPLAMAPAFVAMGVPYVDALFESYSGVTTTGLSTVELIEDRSHLFLFTRAWTQWYGGLGILTLALALVTRPGALARRLSLPETYHDDSMGGTRTHFRSTLTVYATITVVGVVALWFAGADWFESLVYGLAAVSTGGFAPHEASLSGLGGPPLHFTVIALCLAAAIPLAIYTQIVRGRWRAGGTDPQLRTLLIAGAVVAVLLTLTLWGLGGMPLGEAGTHGPLMALSAHTTAGFSSLDIAELDGGSKLVMVLAMAVGGAAGSTAGGVKVLRALILLRVLQAMFTRMSLPRHAVFQPRVGGKRVGRNEIQEALTVVALFAATVLVSWLCFVGAGYDALDSLFEVTSATGTVGLSAGITGPELPTGLKLVLCADMVLGRLEMIALLVVLWPRTWIQTRRRNS